MTFFDLDILWRNAIAAVPLAVVVAAVCRWAPCRPSTRHAMWAGVLLVLLAPPLPGIAERFGLPAGAAETSLTAPTDGIDETAPPVSQYRVTHEATSAGATRSAARAIAPAESLVATPPPAQRRNTPAMRAPAGSADHAPPATRSTRPSPAHVPPVKAPEAPRVAIAAPVHRAAPASSGSASPPLPDPSAVTPQVGAVPRANSLAAAEAPRNALLAYASLTLDLAVDAVRGWLGGASRSALEFRAAVTALPPLPGALWLGGSCVVLLLGASRVLLFRRVLRAATPADDETVSTVQAAAAALGLARIPQISMVTGRVSPMIWCGLRPRLVLPAELWDELDAIGRSAVVSHELAHLRRRDHWLHWAQALIGVVYWWHPVAWWARRRMREEADHCCDAWVTTLLPRGRRSYAQALLATQRYLNHSHPARPAGALAIAGGRARPFARRLTMVMTQRTKPRHSITGFMLAAAVAGAGVVAAPLWACPKDEKPGKSHTHATAPAAPKAPKAPKAPAAPRAPKAPKAPKALAAPAAPAPHAGGATTFEQHMQLRSREQAPADVERRIERLEQRLDRLSNQLERLLQQRGRDDASGAFFTPQPAPADLPGLTAFALEPSLAPVPIGFAGGGEIVRTYELPEGKLEALTKLMSRDDVPVLIRPLDGAIEVRASEPQHMVFRAFVDMIDAEEESREYSLSEGKLHDLTRLMERSDVPVLIVPGDDSITVKGDTLQQRIFGAFVALIEGEHNAPAALGAAAAPPSGYEASVLARVAGAELARASRARIGEQFAALASHTTALDAQARALEEHAEALEREADAMDDKADALRDKADELRDQTDTLMDEADGLEGSARDDLLRHAEELAREAEALDATAESFAAQRDGLLSQAEQVASQAEQIEEQIETIEDQLDDLDDEMSEMEEDEDHDSDHDGENAVR